MAMILINASMSQSSHEKYQYKPFIGSSHLWALEFCKRFGPNTKVLDIGPGSGAIGQELKSRGIANLSAVEIDPEARKHVSSIYQRVESSVDHFLSEKFDLIILLDVLEHMAEPEKFFEVIKELAAPEAVIIVSVPNIAHWSVRIPLLFGFFEYTNKAILDRTHLQHFTRRRLRKLALKDSRLKIVEMASSIAPAELVLPKFVWDNSVYRFLSRIHLTIAQALPGFFAYQNMMAIEVINQ